MGQYRDKSSHVALAEYRQMFNTDQSNWIKRVINRLGFGCPGYARLAYCVARSQLERSLPAFRKLAGSYGLTK